MDTPPNRPAARDGQGICDFAPFSATSVLIVPASDKRESIQFVGPNTGRWTIGNQTPIVLDNGITLSGTAGVIEFTRDRHGDVVLKAWYGIAVAGSGPLGYSICQRP